ncbi:NAD(P)H-hydrate epimerase [Planctomicrobium sp. SH527]|uniref:NAD(P)H-hydrate epimerase n=1 Tax=Planctomicrobium sp. SH527 TaxID=3448123 RepID=UPI003F5C8632
MDNHLVLSTMQLRSIDQLAVDEFGIPSIVLMENAGRSCAEALLELGVSPTGPVCICCGKGNNGGDGFVMARHLAIRDIPVEVLVFQDSKFFSPDALTNYRILLHSGIPVHFLSLPQDLKTLRSHFARASWLVDALLGTGASGGLRVPYNLIVSEINRTSRPVLAVDSPTGLDCNLGSVETVAVQATATITLVARKHGFMTETGVSCCGKILVGDIGIPPTLLARVHPV